MALWIPLLASLTSNCMGRNESTGLKDFEGTPENNNVLNNGTVVIVPEEVLNENIISELLENTCTTMDNDNENHQAGYSTPIKTGRRGRVIKRPARYND
jgi:hypothetical protein